MGYHEEDQEMWGRAEREALPVVALMILGGGRDGFPVFMVETPGEEAEWELREIFTAMIEEDESVDVEVEAAIGLGGSGPDPVMWRLLLRDARGEARDPVEFFLRAFLPHHLPFLIAMAQHGGFGVAPLHPNSPFMIRGEEGEPPPLFQNEGIRVQLPDGSEATDFMIPPMAIFDVGGSKAIHEMLKMWQVGAWMEQVMGIAMETPDSLHGILTAMEEEGKGAKYPFN